MNMFFSHKILITARGVYTRLHSLSLSQHTILNSPSKICFFLFLVTFIKTRFKLMEEELLQALILLNVCINVNKRVG